MVFKKSLLTIVAMGLFAGSAIGLGVGDKMPNLMGRDITQSVMIYNSVVHFYPYPDSKEGSENWEYAGAVALDPRCKPTVKPFAVQSFKDMEIYVDMDGDNIINKVFRKNIKKDSILKIRYLCGN